MNQERDNQIRKVIEEYAIDWLNSEVNRQHEINNLVLEFLNSQELLTESERFCYMSVYTNIRNDLLEREYE